MNFAAKILKENELVYGLSTVKNGRKLWYIVKIEKAKHEVFKRTLEGTALFNLTDFGEILHSGEGEPSDALKDEMREKYGMYS